MTIWILSHVTITKPLTTQIDKFITDDMTLDDETYFLSQVQEILHDILYLYRYDTFSFSRRMCPLSQRMTQERSL